MIEGTVTKTSNIPVETVSSFRRKHISLSDTDFKVDVRVVSGRNLLLGVMIVASIYYLPGGP